jgi:CRP-like cAMP-binding protein
MYGPVDLPALVSWVQDERVMVSTWVFSHDHDSWQRAGQLPELKIFFRSSAPEQAETSPSTPSGDTAFRIKPGSLRRVKILAELRDDQIERFAEFMEGLKVRQWTEIVKQGGPGDAMYLLLEGEVRVRTMIAGKECIFATLGAGECFGEIALFDHGKRVADVVANTECALLRISESSLQRLVAEAPDIAAGLVMAISKTLVARLRAENKRYRDSIAFARTARQ